MFNGMNAVESPARELGNGMAMVNGSPVTVSATGPVKPALRLIFSTGSQGRAVGGSRRNDDTLSERENGPLCTTAVTVSDTGAVWSLNPEADPVTVIAAVAAMAVPLAVSVRVLDVCPVTTCEG
jgi:hypothetical protein